MIIEAPQGSEGADGSLCSTAFLLQMPLSYNLEVEHMLWSSYVPVVQDNLPVGCLQMLVQSESPGGGEQQEEEERNNQKS